MGSIDKRLQELIRRANIDGAVEYTCRLFEEGSQDTVYLTLLTICGHMYKNSDAAWVDTLNDLHNAIAKKEISHIAVVVAKVGILVHKNAGVSASGGDNMDILRKKVIGFFEGGALSPAGEECYSAILPNNTEERDFAIKLLGGFSKIWTENNVQASQNSLEYFTRRRLVLTELNMPVFLWGALLAFTKNASSIRRRHELYIWSCKRGAGVNGLLWAGAVDISISSGPIWSASQIAGFKQLFESAGDISEKQKFIVNPMDYVLAHVPKTSRQEPLVIPDVGAAAASIKVLNIRKHKVGK